MKIINPVGMRFGRLRVTRIVDCIRRMRVECACDCGKYVFRRMDHLKRGVSKSCGCLARELFIQRTKDRAKHGNTSNGVISPTYHSWSSMRSRCSSQKSRCFHRYGGRGITVCDRWNDFRNFLSDMGERPVGTTLHRIDNDKGYSPDNCKWATPKEQMSNRSVPKFRKPKSRRLPNNRLIKIGDETLALVEWSERTGIKANTILCRHRRGWPPEKLLMKARSDEQASTSDNESKSL